MDGFHGFMDAALAEAREAGARGEVPVGAVIVRNGAVIARARNEMRARIDPTSHAEMLAIREACIVLGEMRLTGCDLWVTLEPCAACAGAIAAARISRLYYGAADPKSGGVAHGARVFDHAQTHWRPEVYGGIGEDTAAALLREFFDARR